LHKSEEYTSNPKNGERDGFRGQAGACWIIGLLDYWDWRPFRQSRVPRVCGRAFTFIYLIVTASRGHLWQGYCWSKEIKKRSVLP
jgi:hypothetical protein